MASWATAKASIMTSSSTSSAPASTIVMASGVPQTIRSSDDSCMSVMSGLTTSSPPKRPTRTAPTGPRKGREETISAAEAPLIARMSWACSPSTESVVPMICTSFLKPFGQSGRIGRSTMRAFSVAFSEALPSRLKKPPGILPAAYIFSSMSTVSGKKSMPSRWSVRPTAVARTRVSPLRTATAPSAWRASLPELKVISSPPISTETVTSSSSSVVIVLMCSLSCCIDHAQHVVVRAMGPRPRAVVLMPRAP